MMAKQLEQKTGKKSITSLLTNGLKMTQKITSFRVWLNRKWVDYQDELFEVGQTPDCQTPSEYFRRYRWWLKTQFKLEKNDGR